MAEKQLKVEGSFTRERSSNLSGAPVPKLPPEVIQYMLSTCGSLKLVKICRLVSKSWNEISCTVLKSLSAVSIEEDEKERLEQFKLLLLDRQFQVPHEFPNPFQNYTVHMGPEFPSSISKFVQYPNIRIKALSMILDSDMSATEFKTHLGSCKPFLKRLCIENSCEGSKLLLNPTFTQGWSSLTSLAFEDGYDNYIPNDFARFIQALVQGNPSIKELSLKAGLDTVKKCLLTKQKAGLANLRSISINVVDISHDWELEIACLKEISTLLAPNLKKLKFRVSRVWLRRETLAFHQETVLTLATQHSHNLESFKTNLLRLNQIPKSPKLQTLCCNFRGDDNLEYINGQRFPCLTTLKLLIKYTEIPMFCTAQNASTHVLLNKLDVTYSMDKYEKSGTAAIWPVLGRQFPLVTNISVSFSLFETTDFLHCVLANIGKCFPQLESLELSSQTRVCLFDIPDLRDFTQKEWALRDITNDPILNLKNLVSLKLRDGVSLDRDFIKFGLCQMENWRHLTFPWNKETVKATDICKYFGFLSDLTDIVITYNYHSDIVQELRKLAEETPNVSLKLVERKVEKYLY